jgi:hypothetical protein
MKVLIGILITSIVFFSCDNKATEKNSEPSAFDNLDTTKENPTFFPVSAYIMGEWETMKKSQIKIKRIQKVNGKIDSSILEVNKWDREFKSIFSVEIDSSNLSNYFKETKFLDQDLKAITLTYEANSVLPDSIPWNNWNIYIDPETYQVKSIYLVKNSGKQERTQITWVPNKSCTLVVINENISNQMNKTSETVYYWGE